jgi:hypothetical protein
MVLFAVRAGADERACLALLDVVLARGDVGFEEYLPLSGCLTASDSDSGLMRFRQLQVLNKAGLSASRASGTLDAAEATWLDSRLERDPFGGNWFVPPQRYWDLFDANREQPWAEEAAWEAARISLPRDECFSNCMLDLMVREKMPYWTRLPAGTHIRNVLAGAAEYAKYAAEMVCESGSRMVSRERVETIRVSLRRVGDCPEKREILRSLSRALARPPCGRPGR